MIRNPSPDQEIRGLDDTTGQAIVPVSPMSGPPGDVAGVTVDSMTPEARRGVTGRPAARMTPEARRPYDPWRPAAVRSWIGAGADGPTGRLDFVRRAYVRALVYAAA
jgi:hypothetical protein